MIQLDDEKRDLDERILPSTETNYRQLFVLDGESDDTNVTCDNIRDLNTNHERCTKAWSCDPDGLFNYRVFYYCVCEHYTWGAMVVFAIELVFLFYLLGTAAESYFCPTLAFMSDRLNLTPDVAGVTLLAFGNGAPDVFSTLAGIRGGSFGIAIGELLGAALFASTTIVGTVGLLARCELQKFPFIRDVLFFLVGIVFVMAISFDGKIYMWECFLFIGYYLSYIAFTVIAQRLRAKNMVSDSQKDADKKPLLSVTSNQLHHPLTNCDMSYYLRNRPVNEIRAKYFAKIGIYAPVEESFSDGPRSTIQNSHSEKFHVYHVQHHASTNIAKTVEEKDSRFVAQNLDSFKCYGYCNLAYSVLDFFILRSKWHKKHSYQKVLYLILFPMKICLDLTVPSPKDKYYNRIIYSLYPIFSPLVILLAADSFTIQIGLIPLWSAVEMVGLCASVVIWCTSDNKNPPKYKLIFICISFVLSITWIFLIANEIVSLLEMVGDIFNISQTILGITLLAWGNSASDFAADFVVARKGFQGMAVAACFAGPLMNILIGLGLSLTTQCVTQYPTPYDTGEMTLKLLIGFLFLIVALLSSLLVVPLQKFVVKRPYALYLILYYIIFNVATLTMEFMDIDMKL